MNMARSAVLRWLMILFFVGSLTAEQQLTGLELKIDKTVFLVDENITATVLIE